MVFLPMAYQRGDDENSQEDNCFGAKDCDEELPVDGGHVQRDEIPKDQGRKWESADEGGQALGLDLADEPKPAIRSN